MSKSVWLALLLPMALMACAQLSIHPQAVQPPDSAVAARAIEEEPVAPTTVMVRDFDFSSSSIRDNGSPLHRLINLFRHGSAEEHQSEIGRAAAAGLSEQTVKRLNKLGLKASRISGDNNVLVPDNSLLVTGRLTNGNEGNRLTRIVLGFGAGESSLNSEVRVFRVAHGERAEVLAFTTHADSGRMPGLLPSVGMGELFIGPITALSKAEDTASTGLKIYSSQIDRLASETGDEVARYLSQYAAQEGWIPWKRTKSATLAAK